MPSNNFQIPDYKPFNWIEASRKESSEKRERHLEGESWLRSTHPMGNPPEVDFKLLSMIDGDAFIGKTPNEGGYQQQILSFFHTFFSKLTGDQAEAEIADLFEGAEKISKWTEHPYESFSKKIQEYAAGRQKIWFPAGWTDRITSAHAVMVEIDYSDNSLTIYNTGAGVNEYHRQFRLNSNDPKGKQNWSLEVQGYIKLTCCDAKKIRGPELYQFLYELKNKHLADPNIVLGADNLVEGLKKFLGGENS